MPEFQYRNEKNKEAAEKVEELLQDLPSFCRTYERGIEGSTSAYTRYVYIKRIHVFFTYLRSNNSYFGRKAMSDITYEDLENFEAEDIEEFTHWLRHGNAPASNRYEVKESSINNYLSALNSLWDYALTHGKLKHNVIKDVKRSKRARHEVIRLHQEEEDGFFDTIYSGNQLTRQQKAHRNDVSMARDAALCLLLIRTGLRVSEAVGINLKDLDMKEKFVHVMRKEAKADTVYYSDEVYEALKDYLPLRKKLPPAPGEQALFLVTVGTSKGKRLSVRSVEKLVKKYAIAGAPTVGAAITPHKLRATYATNMIQKTGNLSLVQTEMNHESPSTTSIYIDKRAFDMKKHRNDLDS